MRIAYVTFEAPGKESGVGKKIKFQIDSWIEMRHVVRHLVLNENSLDDNSEGTKYLFEKGIMKPMISAVFYRRRLRAELLAFQPDIVYLRQMLWWPGLCESLKGFNIVQEINSDISNEYNSLQGFSRIKRVIHKFSKGFLDNMSSGFIFVTFELEKRHGIVKVPTCVIANGYVFNPLSLYTKNRNARPQLIFVGSKDKQWGGMDKVVKLAGLIPEMDFHIVGARFDECRNTNLYSYGVVLGEELRVLYRKMDFGIGSLALHRNQMNEASPLKVREYAAHGLPIIAGYKDTDLSGAEYFLNVGNHEKNIYPSMDEIRAFVCCWTGKRFPYEDAERRLSYEFKEEKRIQYFQERLDA